MAKKRKKASPPLRLKQQGTQGQLKKVMIKVVRRDIIDWRHLCYIDEKIFYAFFNTLGCDRSELADFIEKWALLDFNIHLRMTQEQDIKILKELIRDRSRKQYPNLYRDHKTDIQGWTRMWLTRHMKEEIREIGGVIED